MTLPDVGSDGLLPIGDHTLTLTELRRSYLVTGAGLNVPQWDSARRGQLVDNLKIFVRQLQHIGVERIFVNGSFVTAKADPGDIDAYFECELAEYSSILMGLLQLAPSLPWDVTHRPVDRTSREAKPVMWHQYRGEIFPHFTDYPIPTGILDEHGNELDLAGLFRRDKLSLRRKGIVQLVP